jgi:hypothetical protein
MILVILGYKMHIMNDIKMVQLIDFLFGHFCVVSAQARLKVHIVSCHPSCQDARHGTALAFVSCWHNPKFTMSCCALGRAKMPCFV